MVIKKFILSISIFLFIILIPNLNANCEEINNTYYPVILDTDFASDCDDILALRLLLCYQDQGLLDLKGICLSTSYSKAPKAVSCIASYDGYKNIPIGMNINHIVHVPTAYTEEICKYGGYSDYIDTTKLYRKVLSESNEKVNIIVIGFLQNIEDLMNSSPDEYSSLNGMELIIDKVNAIYILGGNLKGTPSFNFYFPGQDIVEASQFVNKYCPVDIYYMSTELGGDVWNGSYHQSEDYRKKDPVTAALFVNHQKGGIIGWDTMGIFVTKSHLYNEMDINNLFILNGISYISDTGAFCWSNIEGDSNRHLIMKTNDGEYYSNKIDGLLYNKFKLLLEKK